ncbi:MAG: hypothetical protein IK081_03420 [Lachnospiraceae bacterium]|nr:hypothetical protein [Lachnospiraceae bacterium]
MYYKTLLTKFTAFVTAGLMTLANLSADVFHPRSENQTSETYACEEEWSSSRTDAFYDVSMAGSFSAASYEGLRSEPLNMTSDEAIAAGYLTPQTYKQEGDPDDTASFQRMFLDAADKLKSGTHNSFYLDPAKPNGFKKCKAIFIPSGRYVISDTIIPHDSPIKWCAFEVSGAGRESTIIQFVGNGKVMFDDRADANATNGGPIQFAFTTFRDIGFDGDNLSTFMVVKDNHSDINGNKIDNRANPNGVQRMQFISCSFTHWHKIIHMERSYQMLSEFTFAFCRIANCGKSEKPCELFYLNDSQAVNWRFVYTDIEGFEGVAFYLERGMGLSLLGGSVIPEKGTVFFLDFNSSDRTNDSGQSNSPHVYCNGTRFEIKAYVDNPEDTHSILLKSTSILRGTPQVTFRTCSFSTGSSNNQSWRFLELNGAANILFDNCYDCGHIRMTGDLSNSGLINPQIKFINCPSFNVEYFVSNSKGITNGSNVQNGCHVIVDDTYDFYLRSNSNKSGGTYAKSVVGLHECRQNVKLTEYSLVTLKNGRTFPYVIEGGAEKSVPVKPYGFVKYVELTAVASDTYKNYSPVTLTFYDGTKQLGEPVEISLDKTQTHMIVINDFVDELTFKVSHSNSTSPEISMDVEIVKY